MKRRRKVILISTPLLLISIAIILIPWMNCQSNQATREFWEDWSSDLSGPPSSWTVHPVGISKYSATVEGKTLYGYKGPTGEIVIPAQFERCSDTFSEGFAIAQGGGFDFNAYIDPTGNIVYKTKRFIDLPVVDGMGRQRSPGPDGYGQYRFIDIHRNEPLTQQYDFARWYHQDITIVGELTGVGRMMRSLSQEFGVTLSTCLDMRYFIIDKQGNELTRARLQELRDSKSSHQ